MLDHTIEYSTINYERKKCLFFLHFLIESFTGHMASQFLVHYMMGLFHILYEL